MHMMLKVYTSVTVLALLTVSFTKADKAPAPGILLHVCVRDTQKENFLIFTEAFKGTTEQILSHKMS